MTSARDTAIPGTATVDLGALRGPGAAMVGLGLLLPLLPHHPGLPCPLRTITGVPCPLCGMSTAVESGLTAHFVASVQANPFGLVAIVVAALLLVVPRMRRLRVPTPVIGVALSASWAWELRRFGVV